MLVTATNELKFHQWPEVGTDEIYNLGISNIIKSLSWSKDNNFLIYLQEGGRPEILTLKDLNNIKPIHVITAIDNASVITFSRKTKRFVAIGTDSSTVALYDTKTKSIAKLFAVPAPVVQLDYNSEDEYLGIACTNFSITLMNIQTSLECGNYSVGSVPTILKFHHKNPNLFGIGTSEGVLYIYNLEQPTALYMTKAHTKIITSIVFSIKNDTLISSGDDNKFCIHDVTQNSCIFRGHLKYPITYMDISTDGKHLAIGTDNGTVIIYETRNYLTPLFTWKPHNSRITFIKFANKLLDDKLSDGDTSTQNTNLGMREENEFKSLYNKYISKSDVNDTLKLLKDDIIADITADVEQLHVQMYIHLDNVQEFIKREFDKMGTQMDDKWDLLNLVSGTYPTDELASEQLYDSENPVVIE